MVNNRFPHYMYIKRPLLDEYEQPVLDEKGDPSDVTVFESICRNYPSSKSIYAHTVVASDYTVSLPIHSFLIRTGDKIEVLEAVRTLVGIVADSYVNNLGANVWYNFNSN